MMTTTERPTFRGVVCLHCKAPVPVPGIVDTDDATESSQRKSQVFNLRCPCCHKEKPYRTREIVDFEGVPETASFPAASAPVSWYPQGGFAKAAKA